MANKTNKNDNKLNAQRGDKPEKITQITKDYMKEYIYYKANTDENKAWYLELCKANTIERMSKKKGKYKDIDLSPVRKEFVKRFFPELNEKETDKTYIEELEDLFK